LYNIDYDFADDSKIKISFSMNNIELEASFGRIARPKGKDILINFGNVYGVALNIIENRGFQIIAITKEEKPESIIKRILESLGFFTWTNPSFFTFKPGVGLSGEKSIRNCHTVL
jgi:hypothetical protein